MMLNAVPFSKSILLAATTLALVSPVTADTVTSDDAIIIGSICAGFDCADGENFGFDTLRLKENNLRIHFDDTSNSASFADNDWRIEINGTENGATNYFSVVDATASKTPFTLRAGARDHALYVAANDFVGLGTNTPAVNLHMKDGDSPAMRIEQDGSSGFTPYIYDIAANETNFFIRDVTNASNLVFRIMTGAPKDALRVFGGSGNVGLGVEASSADGSLHIRKSEDTAASLVLEQTQAQVKWEIKANPATGRMTFKDLNGTTTPFKFAPNAVGNLLRVGVAAPDVVDIAGNLVVSGNCTEADGACADYVFEDDYELRTLDELKSFITQNKHLPNVPSATDMEENGVNLANISGRLLEKIEELTLYTLQQQDTIDTLQQRLDDLSDSAQ